MNDSAPYNVMIVALDGSPADGRVLAHARALARPFASTLALIMVAGNVAPSPDPQISAMDQGRGLTMLPAEAALGGITAAAPNPASPLATAHDQPEYMRNPEDTAATGELNILFNRLRDEGFAVEQVKGAEDLAEAVLAEAQARGAGMIIMAARAEGGLGRLLFGNDADHVLRSAPCPVLFV